MAGNIENAAAFAKTDSLHCSKTERPSRSYLGKTFQIDQMARPAYQAQLSMPELSGYVMPTVVKALTCEEW